MDTLPTELHAFICLHTCFDNGTTVRSLNTVSRYFYEVSRPYLYRNISAQGTNQILALSERLQRTPQHLRQIYHLFLSDVACKPSSPVPKRRNIMDPDMQALLLIVALSTHTLRTFSLVAHSPFCSTSVIARVFRTSFPFLHALTISGFYPYLSLPGNFPSLKSLHLNGNQNPYGLLQMGGLEEACASLTTLTVTGLGSAGAFVVELEDVLGGKCSSDEFSDCKSTLPPTIRSITVQAAPEPAMASMEIYSTSEMALKDRLLLGRLDALRHRKAKDEENVRVTVLERSASAILPEDLRRDWLLGISS